MAGQNADMTLKVGLDLNFFRQELQKASSSLAGQPIDINVRFKRNQITNELRLLSNSLSRKTYDVEVKSTSLEALLKQVNTFKQTLKNLKDEKIELSINASANIEKFSKEKIRKIRAQIRSDIVSGGAGEIQLPTKLAAPSTPAFIKDVAKKVKEQISASSAEGGIPIATKLALPGITDTLKALQKNLNQKDPLRVKVSTTPSIKKADVTAFKTAVSEKFKNITVKVRAELDTATTVAQVATAGPSRTFLQELKDLDKSALQNIYKAAGEDALLAFDEGIINNKAKMAQALSKAAEDASAGFIAALENKKSALFKAAGEYGGALLSGLKKTLKIQSPSREMFDIGDDAGKGFELGLLKAMELAEKSATSQMRRMLDRLARMALMMGGMSAAAINKQVAQSRALPSVNFPATVPPSQSIPIGPSSTGRTLPASRAAAGLIGAAQAPAGLLPSATRQSGLTTGLEALIQSLVSQSRGRGPEGPGSIVSMETGFIPAMRERFAKAAERYLFGVETQVMDLFDAALRQVESAVDLHIAKIQGQISQRMRSAFSVVDLGVQERPMLPGAAAGQAPLMLPSAGGTTPQGQMRFNAVRTGEVIPPTPLMLPPAGGTAPRREMRFNAVTSTGGRGGGYVPPGGFPEEGMLGMLGGRQGPATFIGAGSQMVKLKANLDATVQSVEQFRKSQIPLAGTMQELAGEFGNAAQQVLLYGTAYKALAFFVGLPGQALNAAKSLQTFNNQLNAITGSSENADRAFAFVDNLAARFNVPLESARQGFVKLYASMAPAGFSSGEIENLFSGISKASATLGLSSDKVDRVTYAFSQMASKGQLMSEEVSGQLGDVIPGALSIMAEAARMDIATFKKAMEDGVFVGETFKQVMSNVPIVLENRFGKGAAGAAKTLQGSMNALAISTQKFYESFEPIVSMGAASIFPIIATAINDATQAVQAFTAAMQGNTTPAQMLEGNAAQIYGVLQQLREIFIAVAGVIQGIAPTLMIVGKTFLTTAEYVAKLINTPIGGFLADLAVKAGIALIAVQLLTKTGIVGLISQLILLQRSTAAAGGGLLTFAGNLTKTATAAKLFRLAITGLIGAGILFGIEALVNAIGRMANRLSDARKNAIAARDAIKSMTGAELGEQIIAQQNKLQALSRVQKAGGKVSSEKDRRALEQMGMKVSATGGTFVGGQLIGGQYAVDKNLIESFRIREKEQLKAIQDQRKSLYDTTPLPLNEVDLGAGKEDGKADKKKEYISEIAKIYQKELDQKLLYIEQDASLDDRAKEIQKAAISWQYEHAIAKAEYTEKINASNTKDISNLSLYLDEQKRLYTLEKSLIDARYENIVTKPLRDLLAKEREEQIRLNASINSLAKGREEMTRLEKMQAEASVALAPLNEEQRKSLKPLVDLLFEAAKATDELAESEKKRIEQQKLQKRIGESIDTLREEIALLRGINEEEQKRLKIAQEYKGASQQDINRIYRLEKVRDNIQATREIIDNFVADTSSDYKGFLKEVISGEDAVDALKKFQEGLKDRVLTIFLDFTMAPVEKFFKEVAGGNLLKALFPESAEEKAAAAQANNTTALGTVKTAIELATNAINNLTTTIGGGVGVPSSVNTASFGVSNVGNDLASQLMNERGYEDIAGLLPLPLEKMRQQAARPLRMIWQQIQGAMDGVYGMAEKEIKKTFKPNPAVHQKVLQGIQRVESFRTGPNAWDPGEAQWKERENRWREDKRSKPSSMPLQSFMTTATQMRDSLSEVVRKAGGLAVSSGTRLGSQLDFSDYLSEQQKKILTTGVKEVLNSAMNASFQELRGSGQSNRDPSLMPSFEKATSQIQNLLPSFRTVVEEALSQEAAKGQRYAMDAMKKFGMQAPVDPSFYRSLEYLDPSRGQERLRELSPLNEPPRINPGIEGQFEGASLPFNMQKMSTSYGQLATVGGLSGLIAENNLLEMAGIDLESFASNAEAFKAGTENLNSSMTSVVNATYATAEQMGPEGDAGGSFMKALGATVQGIGIAAGSIMGIMAGINQLKEGGTSNVLGGIGMIASAAGSLLGGISSLGGMFKGGGGANMGGSGYFDPISGKGIAGPNFGLAKGGIIHGGFMPFRAFANGGVVTGPTMGLVGEGRYSEAVVPLPDGRSIPVQLGGKSARDLMGGNAPGMPAAPSLNMKFETTKINGVEYVSREQLEMAMAETRRASISGGAKQGMAMTLDKIKQSPSTRSRIGMR